ncbi:MAG: TonB C-terminal domain-containing protein [Candidatus Desulfofervidus auxilii]|nr:TonB C-terminal domain-containing protein [Candidatus Desulfofervidus auxilii]
MSFKVSLLISFLFHVFLLTIIFYASIERTQYFSFSPVYQVNIVEIPPVKKVKAKKTSFKKVSKKISKRNITKTTSKAISIKKKKTGKNNWEDFLAQRIKSIEKKVKKRKITKVAEEIKEGISGEVLGEFISNNFNNKSLSLAFQVYYRKVWEKIKKNWILPTFLLKEANQLEAIVVLKINRQGKIISKYFEKSSGNIIFDRSVKEAIEKSVPLPALPKDYTKNFHEIGVRFRWLKENT